MRLPPTLFTLLIGCVTVDQAASQIEYTFSKGKGGCSKGKGYNCGGPAPSPAAPPSEAPLIPDCYTYGYCKGCNYSNGCRLRVDLECTYFDANNVIQTCLGPRILGSQPPDNMPFLELTESTCTRNVELDATIRYRICNDNNMKYNPAFSNTFIRYRGTSVEPGNWDNQIPAKSCTETAIRRTIQACNDPWLAGLVVSVSGNLANGAYCQCFNREISKAIVTTGVVTTPPETEPPTEEPTPEPEPTCDFKDVVITELASPEASYAKYIELYFGDENCEGVKITEEIKVISYGPGDCEPSSITIDLKGETIREDGFLTICNSASAEYFYGRGECTVIGGLTSPANLRGTESIAVVDSEHDIIDIFGVPCTDAHPNNKQYFVNGRAVRKFNVWDPSSEYNYEDWHVFPQCGQEVTPEGMDINEWKEVVGPVCAPEATIIITEIVDKDVDSYTNVPRYVELYAPRRRHRGMGFDHNLKLVIFHSDCLEPHWASAVPIDYMPESGFLVVCNKAAYESYRSECAEVSYDIAGPANSNGNDQIALISGDESGWFVVDIYGVIGEDGYDTDHEFLNSRVIRKLHVTEAVATWSKHDWQVCKSDIPDPNKWDSDECGGAEDAPSLAPTDSPTPESQKDCQFFFTELGDCEKKPFIEIKSTCPGVTITRDLTVVSWKEYGLSCEVSLKGMVVPDDGFIIICANKYQHNQEFGGNFDYVAGKWRDLSICDIEDYMLLAGNGFNSYAIKDSDAGCDKSDCVGSNC
eukprot:CAMPEP_0203665574 /NCGR_PEP_ID=MMETSP0090-20130426/2770_1 /ASSEMBLY_ACC=CAM_ASM_001088 /TAXON_ID=426623 /ORGANISM="Chaetoceros affinis, Strain CCMP159" /LENGTH=753 /DNA_ID=CAMNT_0050529181 /DNA_START=68 /DNA_END=2326 /DNA_ORIENTATION=+